MMLRSTGVVGIAAVAVLSLTAFAEARQAPAAEVMPLGLRGVYFVENQGQWSDASVEYGFKSRGLDIAFRESSFTMHLSREVSRNVPVAVAVDPTDGAWASRPYEYQVVERASRPNEYQVVELASRPYEYQVVERASRPYEYQVVERASRPYESATAPEASLKPERGFFSFDDSHPLPHGRGSSGESVEYEHLTLTVTFPGSNPAAPRGAQPQAAKFNYYIGDDESRWASNVPSFGAIVYENLYDGVDLHICGNDDGVLKYEFHVAPGADYSQIRIAYDGIDSLCVDESGDLRIATSFGTLMDSAPLVWQEDVDSTSLVDSTSRAREEAGSSYPSLAHRDPLLHSRGSSEPTRDTIPARFELVDEATYRFALDGPVDPLRTLIIDPDVEWMTHLGGNGFDAGHDIAVDSVNNFLVTGETDSIDFDGRNNAHHGGRNDAFVTKIDSRGLMQWMTYLGGSGDDYGRGVAAAPGNDVVVVGSTRSADFAGRVNSPFGLSDAFVARLSSTGSMLRMSYLGGSSTDAAWQVAIDGGGDTLVSGDTYSADFRGRQNSAFGDFDGFLAKVDPQGLVTWMTYLGGSREEWAYGLVVDAQDDVYLTGGTSSPDFDGRINNYIRIYDAFVVRAGATGTVLWMAYLGGSGSDTGRAIEFISADELVLMGSTDSSDFGGRNNSARGRQDVFVAAITTAGTPQWMTYLGGSGWDEGYGLAVDATAHAIVAGETPSTDFEGVINEYYGGSGDAYLARVNPDGRLDWAYYVGGREWDRATRVVIDQAGLAMVAGVTNSPDFVGRNNLHHGVADAIAVRVSIADRPRLSLTATCPSGGPVSVHWSSASPGEPAVLLFARYTGAFRIPDGQPCAGTDLGLGRRQLDIVFQGRSDPDGSRTLNASAGPGACGGYLQLLDLATCSTSNVARIE